MNTNRLANGVLSHRFSPLLIFSAIYLALSLFLRLVLWYRFGREAGVAFPQLAGVLAAGAVNDQVALLYLVAPFSLYLLLLPRRLAQQRGQRVFFGTLVYLTLFGMLYLMAAEYFFFEEFDARFNLVAVDYLIYPHEVLVNIWETYPVLPLLLAAALLSAVLFRLLRPLLLRWTEHSAGLQERGKMAAAHGLLLAMAMAGFNTDTLAFSENRIANELSANGVSSLFRAFRTNELDYHAYYRSLDGGRPFELLRRELPGRGGALVSPDKKDLSRAFPADPAGLGRMNVVVIVEESFGAGFVGAYGDGRGLTPNFDRLAAQGLLFKNTYATGTRTVRGLEAITCSFPPIPSESIVKRPGNEDIANWGKAHAEKRL